ncbi:MAG: flagellar basal-body rod protein FlgG [Bryobacteraceae bacterium]|nr:flagellar basal-body rod protein FlgG [Solibacteraceae bacterium]MCL4843869.1 flagellar basal-body rod protein FlgG [Bryobacteraceae bacterium]MCO5352910.1 flagellar basal-body rod protein FlgG [Bryobacteraceae bacterium]
MIRALFSAASGMNAQQTNVDNIAHNLANANTVGFKMRRAQFQDLLYQTITQPGAAAGAQTVIPSGLQLGLGTRTVSNAISFAQGSFSATSNPLDLVIEGRGFFQVRRPTGEIAFTRAGQFHLDRDGNLVTMDGNPLEPQITLPPEAQNVAIAADGTVSYSLPGQPNTQLAGQIQLANFANPAGLNSIGRNMYLTTDASGEPTVGIPGGQEGLGALLQGYVEQSNVSVVEEFINLIVSQRAYEANSKVVRAADEMYGQVNNMSR